MTWVDWAIVIVLACSVLGGLAQGFFRTACSLLGLLAGLSLAEWNYGHFASLLLPLVRFEAAADAIAFFLIALVVMAIANLMGTVLGKAFDMLGLGCLDSVGGAVLGFMQGLVLVTLGVLVAVAFFPDAQWLANSRLPRQFFAACHMSTHMSPAELADRVRSGLRILEEDSPQWMHPDK
jgi:membrane protein required for colicin V production